MWKIGRFEMLKTYQDLDDFLATEIENLNYEQAKSLIEFYIQDFIAKMPSEFYKNELPEEQRYFKQLYELVKIDINKWDWQKIEQVIEDINQNAVEIENEYPENCFGLDFYNLVTYYQDFLNHDEKFHLTTIDILIVYFGSLTKLLNIKVRDKEWAINPYIQPYIEKLQYQINKGIA